MEFFRFAARQSILVWSVLLFLLVILIGIIRAIYLLPAVRPRKPQKRQPKQDAAYILVVLGSGGHTTEMFMLLSGLDTARYSTRRYVISEGDNHSITRMQDFEIALELDAVQRGADYGAYDYKIVPRARKIHQSLITTPISTMATFVACFQVFGQPSKQTTSQTVYPDLVIANGPATAFVLIFASFILRYFNLPGTREALRCVYVESWARLHRLSLTGRLLRLSGLCERFLVQWPDLEIRNRRKKQLGEYVGPLVI